MSLPLNILLRKILHSKRINETFRLQLSDDIINGLLQFLVTIREDNVDRPDPVRGWSPERSKALARECLATLREMIDDL